MVSIPTAIPVTPPEAVTVPRAELLLLQVPPAAVSDNVIEAATQTVPGPVITPAFGSGFTVNGVVTRQPVGKVYVIVAVPTAMPVTTPEDVPIAAVPVALLLHVPPPEASVSVVVKVRQTCVVPPIEAGSGFTVTGAVTKQPVPAAV